MDNNLCWLNVTDILISSRPGKDVIAIDGANTYTWDQLTTRVEEWYEALADKPGRTFAVFTPDSFEYSAILLALWQLNKVALLPGDNLPATINAIEPMVNGFLGDFPLDTQPLNAERGKTSGVAAKFKSLDLSQLAIIVLTSGSSGAPKPIKLSLRQVQAELSMHEQLWRDTLGNALVVGTVSHQHFYGMSFRVLWPLFSGRPFTRFHSHYVEDILNISQYWPKIAVITTPSHLSRLPPNQDWTVAHSQWCAVFSSTAPLAKNVSEAALQYLKLPIIEIYGSSETGGIAWRKQTQNTVWECLPGIKSAVDTESSALRLRSPILDTTEWVTLDDRVEWIDETHFHLLGRVDRIAKIEGKRVSLTALEQQITQHPWVNEAKTVVLTQKRTEVGVVARLSEEGLQALDQQGKRYVGMQFQDALKNHFEKTIIPRRWRFVSQLPANTQGKITQAALQELFVADKPTLQSSRTLPEELGYQWLTENRLQVSLLISDDLIYFNGHFPATPILPGVAQVHIAEDIARQYFKNSLSARNQFCQLEAIKFQQVVRPLDRVTLELEQKENKLHFKFFQDDTAYSSGRIVFAEQQED